MSGRWRRRRRTGAAGGATALALTAILAAGCASAPRSEPAKPAAAAPPPPAETVQPEEPKMPPTLVVIDPGGTGEPRSLAEASREERERRRREPPRPPVAVITDENLAEYAAKGKVTEAAPGGGATSEPAQESAAGDSGTPGAGGDAVEGGPRDETYWRTRARDVRERWRRAADEVTALEKESAALRWKFYAEDDPYYRDQQIKPEWDRTLDDLRRARQDVRAYQREVAELMEEGRRAGALPGWLREGIELEPATPEAAAPARRDPQEHQAEEPTVVEEPPP